MNRTYTGIVRTQAAGSECRIPFEVDDAVLEGLSPTERDELLTKKAADAIWGNELAEISYTEGDTSEDDSEGWER